MNSASGSVLIIADIEGSSGCWNRRASEYRTHEWASACIEMSRDIDAVAAALFDAGVEAVSIKDFHRTGYNLLPEMIDRRARLLHGYRRGPVPGIGDPRGADRLLMIGMHAASGSNGFLAHTLTSRIARLEVNGKLMCEAELFAASVAHYGLRPVFLSGCAVACRQAEESIRGYRPARSINPAGRKRFSMMNGGGCSPRVQSSRWITGQFHFFCRAVLSGPGSRCGTARRARGGWRGAGISIMPGMSSPSMPMILTPCTCLLYVYAISRQRWRRSCLPGFCCITPWASRVCDGHAGMRRGVAGV